MLKSSDVRATLACNVRCVRYRVTAFCSLKMGVDRCTRRTADSRTWHWPAFRRTSQVPHCARRLISYAQEPHTNTRILHGSTHVAICPGLASQLKQFDLSYVLGSDCCTHARCSAGHAYGISGSAEDVPQQQSLQLDSRPDISLLAEELQGQWHKQLNRHLGHILIKPYSNRKVWWSCDQCPDSLPHIWEATVHKRMCGSGCPFCSGRAVCQHNTLARKAPEIALFWDAKKNYPLSPDQLTVSSGMRAHWKCSTCLHEWQAAVFNKVCGRTGCPRCAKANGNMPADGTRQKHPTFAAAKHALLQQWNNEKNRESGNFPDNTTLRSNKLIWWQCHACPKGKVHSWQARAAHRTSQKKPTGCPCCAGQKLCECNSLETVCPVIAADFDAEKNGVSAAKVTSSARTKYSWLSDEPGAKKRSVDQRTSYTRKRSIADAKRW